MPITLHHHPYTRAANVIWMLEEVGCPYELVFVDIMTGAHKSPALTKLNPMGKIPTITDGDAVVSESAAIGLYLADRYAPGRLAPALDDARRGTYLRWSLFAPSVIEPACMAKTQGWTYKASNAGWGSYEDMLASVQYALEGKAFLLGDTFSMADVIFGGTLRFMTMFKLVEPTPTLSAYIGRLNERPALQRADARNQQIRIEHGLK